MSFLLIRAVPKVFDQSTNDDQNNPDKVSQVKTLTTCLTGEQLLGSNSPYPFHPNPHIPNNNNNTSQPLHRPPNRTLSLPPNMLCELPVNLPTPNKGIELVTRQRFSTFSFDSNDSFNDNDSQTSLLDLYGSQTSLLDIYGKEAAITNGSTNLQKSSSTNTNSRLSAGMRVSSVYRRNSDPSCTPPFTNISASSKPPGPLDPSLLTLRSSSVYLEDPKASIPTSHSHLHLPKISNGCILDLPNPRTDSNAILPFDNPNANTKNNGIVSVQSPLTPQLLFTSTLAILISTLSGLLRAYLSGIVLFLIFDRVFITTSVAIHSMFDLIGLWVAFGNNYNDDEAPGSRVFEVKNMSVKDKVLRLLKMDSAANVKEPDRGDAAVLKKIDDYPFCVGAQSHKRVSAVPRGILFPILHSLFDIPLSYCYILLSSVIVSGFLIEPDGSTCEDWTALERTLIAIEALSWVVIVCRVVIIVLGLLIFCLNYGKEILADSEKRSNFPLRRRGVDTSEGVCLNRRLSTSSSRVLTSSRLAESRKSSSAFHKISRELCHDGSGFHNNSKSQTFKRVYKILVAITLVWIIACGIGCCQYLAGKSFKLPQETKNCDPLDETECILPFPSNFYTTRDDSPFSQTGLRVALSGSTLPIPKTGKALDPSVINENDGFSTIAPILFYLPGLQANNGAGARGEALPTPTSIAVSLTRLSTTLLIDVESRKLIPHFSEIDSIDSTLPVVILQPASPLSHNRRYMVALINTADTSGELLRPSNGLTRLFADVNDDVLSRNYNFRNVLLPSLLKAAPWLKASSDPKVLPKTIQLMFDFTTSSESSQLSRVRDTRDATMSHLDSTDFVWNDDNVSVVKTIDHECGPTSFVARTVHLKISFPWYLSAFGSGHRGAMLNKKALKERFTEVRGNLKFIVQVPCSLKARALDQFAGQDLNAIVEYGHGLFYSREELLDSVFLQRMGDVNGYLLMAADWRGMSMFDLPIIAKVLMADPSLFRATVDNLIQGYVSKMVMLHYAKNGMLDADFLKFDGLPLAIKNNIPNDVEISFYGISQGGILGAGYNAMMGTTNLLQRSILGAPGTPFALILGRSTDFKIFNDIMLLNFYSSRHIRIMLTVIQHAWDGVEAGGLLSPPVREVPPPVLLQAGLGDAEVPSISAEILARAYGAKILPGAAKPVFGLDIVSGARGAAPGPRSALTEIMYSTEYATVPENNSPVPFNNVHYCVRQDYALQRQIVEFINEGSIVDPCSGDNCFRTQAWC